MNSGDKEVSWTMVESSSKGSKATPMCQAPNKVERTVIELSEPKPIVSQLIKELATYPPGAYIQKILVDDGEMSFVMMEH